MIHTRCLLFGITWDVSLPLATACGGDALSIPVITGTYDATCELS